ncbi:hypothetical protein ACQJBY_039447 [Aegilops geniculata]
MMDPSAKIQRVELPEDVVLEVLVRVADAAALVRCATACKRWRALAADPSFVRRRHHVLMAAGGVYEAEWALSKVLPRSDVDPNQSRLLLTAWMVQGGPILRLFPELEQAGGNDVQNERVVAVLIDAEAGVEKLAAVRYMDSNMAYRIFGRGWSEFVRDCRISHGDRVDLYVGRRGAGQRCLLFFTSKGAQA